MAGMRRWAEIRSYVRFQAEDEAVLRAAYAIVRPRFDAIVDVFYARIMEHEGARRVLEGPAQIERQKQALRDWLEGCFTGPWDEAYFQIRSRIGRIHVRIGLEPRYMILGMNLVRLGLQEAVGEKLHADFERWRRTMFAIAKLCDVELAIMLETYGDEFIALLKRRERLAAIGQLGASISHEVKNPLGVIASSVYALKEHCRPIMDEAARRHIDKIERNVEQANEIVTVLLEFLRARTSAREERDWNALVGEATFAVHLPESVRAELALAPDAGRAAVDPGQVARVIANLVQNAAEAMTEGGVVTISTGGDEDTVELIVRDHGPGLPSEVLPQLFEPLFTTKPVGTGLGLALTKAIVESHQGTIKAANAPGGGAEFRVRLPRAAPATEDAAT